MFLYPGVVDCKELFSALEELGVRVTKEYVQAMLSVVNDNGDGTIDKEQVGACFIFAMAILCSK
jgi:Ca2+-binding EF-hand superfamily protein